MAVKPIIKGFEYFLERLLKGFRSVEKREPNNLEMILIKQEAGQKARDANKVIKVDFGEPFGEQIKKGMFDDIFNKMYTDYKGGPKGVMKLVESGDVKLGKADKTPPYQKSQADIEQEIMEKIKTDNEKAIKAFESRNPNKKPRDEKYTGGLVDVEPSLSDIGHGSDALMARTRLMSPGSQATTSTGLNYLLAEDNDNIRVPFAKGKLADAARRKFMKAAGAAGAGITALKTGLLGFGEKAAPVAKEVIETVSETAQSVPPYFFNLVNKIKTMGDETMATQDKAIAKKYKDYVMEEDFAGNITIIKKNMDDPYPEEVIMSYKVDDASLPSGKGMAKVDEYEEFTVTPDGDGKMKDIQGGVPDEVVQEGTMFEDNMTEFGKTKKADGGRIGYSKGKAVLGFLEILKDPKKIREAIDNIFKTGDYKMDAELAAESLVELNPKAFGNKLYDDLDDKTRMEVYGAVINDVMGDVSKKIKEKKTGTYKFLKKVFGDSLEDMPDRDPEMYQGLKEVVPMFRKKDKEGLKMYMQKYLPHMDDTEIEEFIVGEGDIAGLRGQLLRLGSGRDYAGKLEMMKKADNMRKLDALDVDKMKPNANGGLITMLGE